MNATYLRRYLIQTAIARAIKANPYIVTPISRGVLPGSSAVVKTITANSNSATTVYITGLLIDGSASVIPNLLVVTESI